MPAISTPLPSMRARRSPSAASGFTLVELMVAMVVMLGVMAVVFIVTRETGRVWKNTSGKIETFRNARIAFETMTRLLSQATLNTYYDYVDANGNFATSTTILGSQFAPSLYCRRSDLHFLCGPATGSGGVLGSSTFTYNAAVWTPSTHAVFFQAPAGMVNVGNSSVTAATGMGRLNSLLNACGFYVAYGPDPAAPSFLPATVAPRYRYRLMQFLQPADNLAVYQTPMGAANASAALLAQQRTWFRDPIVTSYSATSNYVLAENIVALVILPKYSSGEQTSTNTLAPNYSYDTRNATFTPGVGFSATFNQLPPVLQITLVAIDEPSAIRLGNDPTPPDAMVGLTPGLFTAAPYASPGTTSQLQLDLQTMQATLAAHHLNFRIFQTEVAVRSAKWTSP